MNKGRIVLVDRNQRAREFAATARRYADGGGWSVVATWLPEDCNPDGVLGAYRRGFPHNTVYDPLLASCECCGADADVVVRVDTAHTDEYGESEFCVPCVRRMLGVTEGE